MEEPFGINIIKVNTNEEMYCQVMEHFSTNDIIIKSAAVADYKPKEYSTVKIKKTNEDLKLTLVRDNDILKKLGELKRHQILVGFAAESNDLLANAQSKLKGKNLDFIVANDITSADTGFASDENKVVIISRDGKATYLEKMSKREVARKLFDLINI
jgi:phosphopantothenoylcysteine decarboxylase/phosphopantothenate--cysteine ligase